MRDVILRPSAKILAGGFLFYGNARMALNEVEIRKKRPDIRLEVHEERKMTDSEVESVAFLLFSWWKWEYEHHSQEQLKIALRKQ